MLLQIQNSLNTYEVIFGKLENYDDQERYLEMSMKINPNDPHILTRNMDFE